VLPEPTRVEGQEFGNGTPNTGTPNAGTPIMRDFHGGSGGGGGAGMNGTGIGNRSGDGFTPASFNGLTLQYSDDELAVLAESFFHQRQEVEGSVNWWNGGELGDG
jgi:hypothetical protein